MKEEILKSYIRKFRDKMLIAEEGEAIFTHPYCLTFHDIAIKEGWIEPDTKLDKGYLIRISNKVFKEDVEPEERPRHQLISLTGTTRIKFQKAHGFDNKVITGYRWKDRTLSPYCYDTMDLLGEYKKVKDFLIKRPTQYLHPENPFEDAFTKAGRKDLLLRLKCLNYDAENINHNRNVIHIEAAMLSTVDLIDDKIDLINVKLDKIDNKIDKVIEHQTQMDKKLSEKLDIILNILSKLPKNG